MVLIYKQKMMDLSFLIDSLVKRKRKENILKGIKRRANVLAEIKVQNLRFKILWRLKTSNNLSSTTKMNTM